jgi:sRNA-binding regulator protein Hfq
VEIESSIENKKLEEYASDNVTLIFNLITGGIVKGKIKWVDKDSIGIILDGNQNIILYKHVIAFIQEKAN